MYDAGSPKLIHSFHSFQILREFKRGLMKITCLLECLLCGCSSNSFPLPAHKREKDQQFLNKEFKTSRIAVAPRQRRQVKTANRGATLCLLQYSRYSIRQLGLSLLSKFTRKQFGFPRSNSGSYQNSRSTEFSLLQK